MRFAQITPVLLLLAAAVPGGAAAQQSGGVAAPALVGALPTHAGQAGSHHRASLLRVLAYGTGGSIVGGWTGFMTSQVIWSDWLRGRTALAPRRIRFTLGGAALGALGGIALGLHQDPRSAPAAAPGILVRSGSITAEQIRAIAARDAAEAVRLLRPNWLNARGQDFIRIDAASLDSTARSLGPPAPQPPGIRVYLDEELLGGLDQLATIDAERIARIEWWDARAATVRWGAGHSHGAIRIVTNASES